MSTEFSWQDAFTRRLGQPRFRGTGWENLFSALNRASSTSGRGAKPFWLGVELTQPGSPGYAGVLCANAAGEVLCTGELQRRTSVLLNIRKQWPEGRLRFLADMNELRSAARRSHVFGAVVDAANPSALSLARSLAKAISIGNTRTALRVLSLVSPPSSRRRATPADPPPTPAAFDVLLRSKTTEPWYEHRDLALMCAVQKEGLIGIDFTQVLGIFKSSEYIGGRWVSSRLGLTGAKARGVARGPGRAERAAKRVLRDIAAHMPLAQIAGGTVDIAGDARLAEIKVAMQMIRAACPDEAQFILGCDARGQGPFLEINLIALTGRPAAT
jgi:hypothetical protein